MPKRQYPNRTRLMWKDWYVMKEKANTSLPSRAELENSMERVCAILAKDGVIAWITFLSMNISLQLRAEGDHAPADTDSSIKPLLDTDSSQGPIRRVIVGSRDRPYG